MGVCAHKKDREDSENVSQIMKTEGPLKAQILQSLVDKRKSKHVPVLSLADNPLYLRRLEEMKHEETRDELGSPLRTAETKV